LDLASAGFTVADVSVGGNPEPVILEEESQTLEILFQFVHPRSESDRYRQPSVVIGMELPLFFRFAEAAEKYLLSGAMNTCITRMYQIYTLKPIEVLNHCVKYGYEPLADLAAPLTISLSIGAVVDGLTVPGLLARWLKYYNHYLQVAQFGEELLISTFQPSQECKRLSAVIGSFARSTIIDLRSTTLPQIDISLPSCQQHHCPCRRIWEWQDRINQKIKAIPTFSNILRSSSDIHSVPIL